MRETLEQEISIVVCIIKRGVDHELDGIYNQADAIVVRQQHTHSTLFG
jgi:hypothetical protein